MLMNIREMRSRLGITQSEFAARYNIPFRTVQNWEEGVRKPPKYVLDLLSNRIEIDLVNRKTTVLPKYNPQKSDLPKRSDFVGALAWLKAVNDCIGEPVVFALDEALMCQGNFGGRSDEYIIRLSFTIQRCSYSWQSGQPLQCRGKERSVIYRF